MRFGFHARWLDDVKCGLFSNHAPLGQTTYVWDEYLYSVWEEVKVRMAICVTVCVVVLCVMMMMMKGREKVKPGADS